MNEKLKNYTEQPDPAVWEGIKGTVARRKAVRRVSWVAAGLVAVGAVVVLALPGEEEAPAVAELSMPAVVELASQPVVSAPAEEEPKVMETNRPVEVVSVSNKVEEAEQQTPAVVVNTPKPMPEPLRAEEYVAAPVAVASAQKDVTVASVGEPAEPRVEEPLATNAKSSENTPTAKSPANGGVSNVPDTFLWFPNVFAPASDNDGINRFRAQLNQEGAVVKDFRMAIYNRAGTRVFFSNNIDEAWDGTRDGQPLPQSSYVYVVFYTDNDDVQHHCKGTVTLVR